MTNQCIHCFNSFSHQSRWLATMEWWITKIASRLSENPHGSWALGLNIRYFEHVGHREHPTSNESRSGSIHVQPVWTEYIWQQQWFVPMYLWHSIAHTARWMIWLWVKHIYMCRVQQETWINRRAMNESKFLLFQEDVRIPKYAAIIHIDTHMDTYRDTTPIIGRRSMST